MGSKGSGEVDEQPDGKVGGDGKRGGMKKGVGGSEEMVEEYKEMGVAGFKDARTRQD